MFAVQVVVHSTLSGFVTFGNCVLLVQPDHLFEDWTARLNPPQSCLFVSCAFPADDGSFQRDSAPPLEDRRKSRIPEEFAGLLHGSSPACETPDTPYHLYNHRQRAYSSAECQSSLLQPPDFNVVIGAGASKVYSRTGSEPPLSGTEPRKQQVVYRTVFHTKVNQDQVPPRNCEVQVDQQHSWSTLGRPPSSLHSGQNGELPEFQGIQTGGSPKAGSLGAGFEEGTCTLGRMRSMPRSVLDLQLSKSLSKSDSNLVAVSPIQVSCC